MQLGIDAGNARVKVAGVQGVIDFDAALGEWRERNLVTSMEPMTWRWNIRLPLFLPGASRRERVWRYTPWVTVGG